MVIDSKATPVDGLQILGETFTPADNDSAQAIYERNGRVCGVTYECGTVHPYLRYCPGFHLPPNARDKQAWRRFAWKCEDERMVDIKIDERDGEPLYITRSLSSNEDVGEVIECDLDFLLGDELHDAVIDYARSFTSDTSA